MESKYIKLNNSIKEDELFNGVNKTPQSNTDLNLIRYNFDLTIQYNSNEEYRKCIRELFYMENIIGNDDIDDETKDELDYDDETISKTMDLLFDMTKNNTLFQELYDLAAGLMFSTNREIGIVVLFSYDNLPLFHNCLASFYREPELYNEKNEHFIRLNQKLS